MRFFALPSWALNPKRKNQPPVDQLAPKLEGGELSAIADRCEFRSWVLVDHCKRLLKDTDEPHAVLAQPPNDLPALLRTADQLLAMSRHDGGSTARVWRCECGCHYSLEASLVGPVAIKCDRCGRTIDLDIGHALSHAASPPAAPEAARLAAARKSLSEFFREAMARGWPVLVARE